MSTATKLAQRVPNRSIFNKLYHYSNRTVTTFNKWNFYPSISSVSTLNNNDNIRSNICQYYLRPNTSYHRSMSTATQDKNEKDEEQDSCQQSSDEEEEAESESDGETNQQIADLQSKIEEMESEIKKLTNALARSHADIINIQNMSKKDVENAKKFA